MSLNCTKLVGVWYNQLGSKVTLNAVHPDGGLDGLYHSTVGDAEYDYALTGRFDTDPPTGEGVSVGWVVTYRNNKRNAHSTATWSGQYFDDLNGGKILTHWLLTSSTPPGPKFVWNSTNLGTATFTRTAPTTDEIEKAQASSTVGLPHPDDTLAAMNLTPDS